MKKRSITRRLAAVGTLIACTAAGIESLERAYAQEIRRPAQSAPPAGQTQSAPPVRRFEISPGRLAAVLTIFESATELHVIPADAAMLELASSGVSGVYTAEQALQKLLAGTGLDYRFTARDTVTLQVTKVSTTIEVTASAPLLAESMPKYSQPLNDTPQSISVVSGEVMDRQGATTLRDALRNVAGISLAAGEGGAQGDNLTIRGFTARNDLFIDGMRDFGSYYRDPFNTAEVEVLQGPSSVTFGRGSTGGVVNQASKTPTVTALFAAQVDLGTDATRRVTLDYDTPLPSLGKAAAFRVNLMGDMGDVAGRDVAENRRFGVAPSLALGWSASRMTFSILHQTADDTPDYGIPWLFNGPAPVNRSNYYGFEHGNFLRTNDDIGTLKFEHDFNSHVTLRSQTRYANYLRDARITEPQIPSTVTLSTPLSAIQINRNEITVNSAETNLDQQVDLIAAIGSGVFRQSLIAGVEAQRETSDPTRLTYTGVPTTSLLNPNPMQTFAGTPTISSQVKTTAVSTAAYVLDTIHLGRKWEVMGGLRWDRFDASYTQSVAPVASFERVDDMPSWRTALVFHPQQTGTLYLAAGTSFNPSAESLSLSAATASLPPEHNTNYEFGGNWGFGNRLTLRAAMFRTEKTNAREPDPTNPLLDVLAGNERVQGVQAQASGYLTRRWEVTAGYALLDSGVVSSQYYPAAVGARLANVPRNTFNVWSEVHLPWHSEFGAGGNYVSSRTASSTAPFDPITGLVKEVPSYWVFNLMFKHRLNDHTDVQVNVNNVADRYYYDELHPAHIVLGPGRSALVGIKFKF
jgi:catecholate siderophore receptor